MTEPSPKSFVAEWISGRSENDPSGHVIQAISASVSNDTLDEQALLQKLKPQPKAPEQKATP